MSLLDEINRRRWLEQQQGQSRAGSVQFYAPNLRPPSTPTPPPPVGHLPDNGSILSQLTANLGERKAPEQDGHGTAAGRGLGFLVNNPVTRNVLTPIDKVFMMPQRLVASTIQEIADTAQGEGFSPGDWWDQVNDRTFGMGDVIPDTGNKWFDTGVGVLGDVVTDPWTYLTFGTSAIAGKAARATQLADLSRAQKTAAAAGDAAAVAKLGGTEALERLGQRGVGVANDAQLAAMKLNGQGLRLRNPITGKEWSAPLRGTETIGRGVNELTGAARVKIKNLPGARHLRSARNIRGYLGDDLGPAFERILTGKGPMSIDESLQLISLDNMMRRSGETWGTLFTHELENVSEELKRVGPAGWKQMRAEAVAGKQNILTRLAAKAREVAADPRVGVVLPELEGYSMPQILTRDFRNLLKAAIEAKDTNAVAFENALTIRARNLTEESGFLQHRVFVPGETVKIGDSSFTIEVGTIDELNDKFAAMFPGFKGKIYEENPIMAYRQYIRGVKKDVAKRAAAKEAAGDMAQTGLRFDPGAPDPVDPAVTRQTVRNPTPPPGPGEEAIPAHLRRQAHGAPEDTVIYNRIPADERPVYPDSDVYVGKANRPLTVERNQEILRTQPARAEALQNVVAEGQTPEQIAERQLRAREVFEPIRAERTKVNAEVKKLRKQLANNVAVSRAQQNEITHLVYAEIAAIEKRLGEATQELAAIENQIAGLKATRGAANKDLKKLRARYQQAAEKRDALESVRAAAQADIDVLENQIAVRIDDQMRALEEQVEFDLGTLLWGPRNRTPRSAATTPPVARDPLAPGKGQLPLFESPKPPKLYERYWDGNEWAVREQMPPGNRLRERHTAQSNPPPPVQQAAAASDAGVSLRLGDGSKVSLAQLKDPEYLRTAVGDIGTVARGLDQLSPEDRAAFNAAIDVLMGGRREMAEIEKRIRDRGYAVSVREGDGGASQWRDNALAVGSSTNRHLEIYPLEPQTFSDVDRIAIREADAAVIEAQIALAAIDPAQAVHRLKRNAARLDGEAGVLEAKIGQLSEAIAAAEGRLEWWESRDFVPGLIGEHRPPDNIQWYENPRQRNVDPHARKVETREHLQRLRSERRLAREQLESKRRTMAAYQAKAAEMRMGVNVSEATKTSAKAARDKLKTAVEAAEKARKDANAHLLQARSDFVKELVDNGDAARLLELKTARSKAEGEVRDTLQAVPPSEDQLRLQQTLQAGERAVGQLPAGSPAREADEIHRQVRFWDELWEDHKAEIEFRWSLAEQNPHPPGFVETIEQSAERAKTAVKYMAGHRADGRRVEKARETLEKYGRDSGDRRRPYDSAVQHDPYPTSGHNEGNPTGAATAAEHAAANSPQVKQAVQEAQAFLETPQARKWIEALKNRDDYQAFKSFYDYNIDTRSSVIKTFLERQAGSQRSQAGLLRAERMSAVKNGADLQKVRARVHRSVKEAEAGNRAATTEVDATIRRLNADIPEAETQAAYNTVSTDPLGYSSTMPGRYGDAFLGGMSLARELEAIAFDIDGFEDHIKTLIAVGDDASETSARLEAMYRRRSEIEKLISNDPKVAALRREMEEARKAQARQGVPGAAVDEVGKDLQTTLMAGELAERKAVKKAVTPRLAAADKELGELGPEISRLEGVLADLEGPPVEAPAVSPKKIKLGDDEFEVVGETETHWKVRTRTDPDGPAVPEESAVQDTLFPSEQPSPTPDFESFSTPVVRVPKKSAEQVGDTLYPVGQAPPAPTPAKGVPKQEALLGKDASKVRKAKAVAAAELEMADERLTKLEAAEIATTRQISTDQASLDAVRARQDDLNRALPTKTERSLFATYLEEAEDGTLSVIEGGRPPTIKAQQRWVADAQAVAAANDGSPEALLTESLLRQDADNLEKLAAAKLEADDVSGIIRDARSGKLHNVIAGVLNDQWEVFIKGMGDEPDILIMKRMLAHFDEALKPIREDPGLFARTLLAFTNFFKTYATATPGFHVRNGMSAVFNNLVDGVGLRHQARGVKLWREWAETDDVMGFWRALSREEQDAFQAVFASGSGGRFFESGVGEATSAAGRRKEAIYSNRFTVANQRFGQNWVEGPVRLGMALDSVAKGHDVTTALDRITRIHFDYAQTSQFDEEAKKLIPFWTFMSRNIPTQVALMWTKPRVYNLYGHIKRNLGDPADPNTPAYWMQAGAWNTGVNMPFTDVPLYLQPDFAHTRIEEDSARLAALGEGNFNPILSSFNPFFTAPVEYATGTDIYSGFTTDADQMRKVGPLEIPAAVLGLIMGKVDKGEGGLYVNERLAQALQSLVPDLDRANRLMPSLSGDDYRRGSGAEGWLRYGGAPVRMLTPERVAAEKRRRRREEAERAAMKRQLAG